MRSPRQLLREEIRSRGTAATAQYEMAAQLRVWRRGPSGKAEPAELLPRVYGGCYSTTLKDYTGEAPKKILEIPCHPGQVPFLTEEGHEMRVLALGAPGGGKSFAAIRKAVLCCLELPNKTIGIIAPVAGAKHRLWEQFREVVEPVGWLKDYDKKNEIAYLWNGAVVPFLAAKEASASLGVPFKDINLDVAIEDEHHYMTTKACRVVNTRGRRAGKGYRIYSTASDFLIPEFQLRLQEWYLSNPGKARVVPFKGADNVFTDPEYWEWLKSFYSEEDYRREFEADHSSQSGRVYHAFDPSKNVRKVLDLGADITASLCYERFGKPYQYIVGYDPGSAQNSCHALKAFRDPGPFYLPAREGEARALWFVVKEFVSRDTTTREHAEQFAGRVPWGRDEMVWLIDPHVEGKETDKSDRRQIMSAGMDALWASPKRIPQKHRFQMVNALFCDATGHRRLFFAADAHGKTVCPLGVQSAQLYRHEDVGKKGRGDLSHHTDDLGYALFPFEKIRGLDQIRALA